MYSWSRSAFALFLHVFCIFVDVYLKVSALILQNSYLSSWSKSVLDCFSHFFGMLAQLVRVGYALLSTFVAFYLALPKPFATLLPHSCLSSGCSSFSLGFLQNLCWSSWPRSVFNRLGVSRFFHSKGKNLR